jgi:predicted N-acetyltransferase YhbS
VTVDGAAGWYGIGPLSTRTDHRRRGIGALLMRTALARLEAKGARGAVLLGDPAYYARFGFAADPALTWRDAPSVYVQGLAFAGEPPRGEIAYHPAFG